MWLNTDSVTINLDKVDIMWKKNLATPQWVNMKKALKETTAYFEFVKTWETGLVFISKECIILV